MSGSSLCGAYHLLWRCLKTHSPKQVAGGSNAIPRMPCPAQPVDPWGKLKILKFSVQASPHSLLGLCLSPSPVLPSKELLANPNVLSCGLDRALLGDPGRAQVSGKSPGRIRRSMALSLSDFRVHYAFNKFEGPT